MKRKTTMKKHTLMNRNTIMNNTLNSYLPTRTVLTGVSVALISALGLASNANAENTLYEALSSGTAFADINIRYEGVTQDNDLEDANALTVRTRLGYRTDSFKGFSFTAELEDTRIALGVSDYTVGPTGFNPGEFSVIADPEFTELDQGFLQYKNDSFTAKVGRQVITLDGHRFVGHVGWRQDRQTFDAATAIYAPNKDLRVQYSYIDQRNRIFGEVADVNAKDHIINGSYQTVAGKLVAYAYLIEADTGVENGLDTYGFSFNGAQSLDSTKISYHLEYATQTSDTSATSFEADYLHLNLGVTVAGVTAKVAYEALGSDDGAFGFSTPLATLHKFNGWSDQFLATPSVGLVDTNFTLSGTLAGGKWLVRYHDFQADVASETVDELGTEINFHYSRKVAKNYTLAMTYASYAADDFKVDTDKLWVWLNTKF